MGGDDAFQSIDDCPGNPTGFNITTECCSYDVQDCNCNAAKYLPIGIILAVVGVALIVVTYATECIKEGHLKNGLTASTYSAMAIWGLLLVILTSGPTAKFNKGTSWTEYSWDNGATECYQNIAMQAGAVFAITSFIVHVGLGWSIYGCTRCCCNNQQQVVVVQGGAPTGQAVVIQ